MSLSCKSSYFKVNGIWAKCLSVGLGPLEVSKPSKLVLVIPGNPGLSGFYDTFMAQIKNKLGDDEWPIWCLGHAGHDAIDDGEGKGTIPIGRDVSSLKGQILQKVSFLNEYVLKDNEDCEVTLVGHSVGALIALKVMQVIQVESKVKFKIYGLFPMIERMYQAPSGPMAWIQTAYMARLLIGFIWILDILLPQTCRKCMIAFHTGTSDNGCLDAICDLLNWRRMYHILNMGYTELKEVKHLDYDFMRANADNIRLYYGQHDSWCPVEFYFDLKKQVPDIKAELCNQNLPHAFVLKDTSYMAQVVGDWIFEDSS